MQNVTNVDPMKFSWQFELWVRQACGSLQLAYVKHGQSIVGSHKPREAKLTCQRLLVAVDGTTRDRCWPLVDLSRRHDGSLLKDGVSQLYR